MHKQRPRLFLALLGIQIILQNGTTRQVSPRPSPPRQHDTHCPQNLPPSYPFRCPSGTAHMGDTTNGISNARNAQRKVSLSPPQRRNQNSWSACMYAARWSAARLRPWFPACVDRGLGTEGKGGGEEGAYLVDHDLTGFKRPVVQITLVPDDPPNRIIHMIL